MSVAMLETGAHARGFQAKPGLSMRNLRCIAHGGFGDGHNSYAHSMAWFDGKLYVGTTRSNLCMIRVQSAFQSVPFHKWPVECPENLNGLYHLDRCAQIWCYDPATQKWEMVHRSPMVKAIDGDGNVGREMGYRSMEVFQGEADPKPALYVAAWAPSRAPGGHILRSYDGLTFEPVTRSGIFEQPVSTTRCLTSFNGCLFFSPTARRGTEGGQQNTAGRPLVFESRDPAAQNWIEASESGFGDAGNLGIFSMIADEHRLYAGTFNLSGLQVWASECRGNPPYRWKKIVDRGAGRGGANQVVMAMVPFKGAVYVGTGIQGGGIDRVNKVGPEAPEVIRINRDDSWDLIVGEPRRVGDEYREPLSGLRAGFGNFYNGYIWALGVHDDWLYAGTYDWSVMLRWSTLADATPRARQFFQHIAPEEVDAYQGGADFWRSRDGENWLPVSRQGFGNAYNFGIRNIVSTPHGMFVGTANAFGPRVAVKRDSRWVYDDNPRGGLEVWLGNHGAPV
jgi:hypothetical protein